MKNREIRINTNDREEKDGRREKKPVRTKERQEEEGEEEAKKTSNGKYHLLNLIRRATDY